MRKPRLGGLGAILLLWGVSAAELHGLQRPAVQQIGVEGLIRQAGADSHAVSGAEVELAEVEGNAVYRRFSDSAGRFRILVDATGLYRLTVARIGYEGHVIEALQLEEGELARVTIDLQPRPVSLDRLRVTTASSAPPEFWERKQRLSDRGHFITPEYIEATYPQLSFFLRDVPGVHVEWTGRAVDDISFRTPGTGGGRCEPATYLNGIPLPTHPPLTEYVDVEDIVGIEVYRSSSFAPEGYRSTWGCGVILVWARSSPPERPTWIAPLLLLGLIGALIL